MLKSQILNSYEQKNFSSILKESLKKSILGIPELHVSGAQARISGVPNLISGVWTRISGFWAWINYGPVKCILLPKLILDTSIILAMKN